MAKKLHQTFNGDQEKQVETTLKILWALRNDSEFYFFSYGKDLLNRYFSDCKKDSNEQIKHLQALVDNKNAFIENIDKTSTSA